MDAQSSSNATPPQEENKTVITDHISTLVIGGVATAAIIGIVVLGSLGIEDNTLHDVALALAGALGGVSLNKAGR